jgi:hypothetical protein
MNGDRTEAALARIDAALTRIESAAQTPRAVEPVGDLAARHARLKSAVAESLRQIDTLIEGAQG